MSSKSAAAKAQVSVLRWLFALLLLAQVGHASAEIVVSQDSLVGNNYVMYRESTDATFRFGCQSPCPIPDGTLRSALTGFRAGKALLLNLWGIDVVPALAPVDIFFETNSVCPSGGSASGYATTYQPYGSSGPRRGIVCLFHWDRFVAGVFGADWFTPEHAGDLLRQVLILHEYGHVVMFERHVASYEHLVTYYSFRATGAIALPQGPCTGDPLAGFAPLVNLLCVLHGVNDADLKAAWLSLDQLFLQGLGYGPNGATDMRTSVSQWRRELDVRKQRATGNAFVLSGSITPQQAGGEISLTSAASRVDLLDGRFRLDVPAGAVSQATALKLEAAGCAASHPNLDFNLVFELVSASQRAGSQQASPAFNAPVQMRYSFAHANIPSAVDPRSLRLYRLSASCSSGMALSWIEVPGARLDPIRRLISAPITQGGTFAVLPATGQSLPSITDTRVLPHAGPWYQASTNGSGLDIEFHTDQTGLAVTWYTYRADGSPVWYLSVGTLTSAGQTAPLTEVTRNADGTRTIVEVGQLRLRFATPETAVMDWSIGAQSGTIPDLQFLRFSTQPTRAQANGLWYTPEEPGWGVSIWSQGTQEFWVHYIYDQQGRPTWLSTLMNNSDVQATLQQNRGACPSCPYVPPSAVNAGSFVRQHITAGSAYLSTSITLAAPLQGNWNRTRRPLLSVSDYVAEQQ